MQLLQNCHGLSHSHGSNLLFEVQTEMVVGRAAFINITLGQVQYSEETMQHTKHQHHFLSTLWRSYPSTGLALRLLPLKALEQCDSKDSQPWTGCTTASQNKPRTLQVSWFLRAAGTDLAGYIRRTNSGQPFRTTKGSQMPTVWYFDRNLNKGCFQQLLHFPLLTAVLTPYSQGMTCTIHFGTLIFPCEIPKEQQTTKLERTRDFITYWKDELSWESSFKYNSLE